MAPKKAGKGKAVADDDYQPSKRSRQHRGGGSTHGNSDTEMPDQPDYANLPEAQWPENTLPDHGLRFRTQEERDGFEFFLTKRIVQSKYVHIPTLQSLGILDEVRSLMSTLGIWDYCTTAMTAYRTLTYEFLSTISKQDNEDVVRYFLDGRPYSITINQINEIMGFPISDNAVELPAWGEDTSFYDFSCQLIGGPRKTYKAAQISHPVFRYIQRALAFTIFARGETVGTMNENETFFIYAMLYAHTRPEILPNVGAFMIEHILGLILNHTPRGMISIGGFVTRLAIYHGVIPSEGPVYRVRAKCLQKQTEFIDMAYLQTAVIFTKVENHFFFISNNMLVPLPLTVRVDRTDPATWILPADLVLQYPHHPAGAAAAAHPGVDPFGGPQAPEHPQPPPFWAPGPGQVTPQQMFELMQRMNENITQLHTSVNERFSSVDRQLTDLTGQMGRMQVQYTDLAGIVDEMAEQQHGTYHRTDRMYAHMSESGLLSSDQLPRRRRPRRPSPHTAGTSSHETAPPPPPA